MVFPVKNGRILGLIGQDLDFSNLNEIALANKKLRQFFIALVTNQSFLPFVNNRINVFSASAV
jgi:hypothetical protein